MFNVCCTSCAVDSKSRCIDTGCLEDQNFHLRLEAPNDRCYRIELSDDLKTWELTEVCPLVEGALHFVDPEASERPHRFYRARLALDVEVFAEEE